MYSRFTRWTFAMALVLITASGDGQSIRPKSKKGGKPATTPRTTHRVCPMYAYAYHQGYWSYYALDCDAGQSPVSLDAAMGLCPTCSGCSDGSPPCQQVPYKRGGAVVKGVGEDGFEHKRNKDTMPTVADGRYVKVVTKQYGYVTLRNQKSFWAKLIVYEVNPPGLGKRFFGVGFQIEPNAAITEYMVFDESKMEVERLQTRRFLLKAGSIQFQVIVHNSFPP